MEKKVAICLCTYNRANIIEHIINNSLSQTYNNKCLYVVDGNSTDNSVTILSTLRKTNKNMRWYGGIDGYINSHNAVLTNAIKDNVDYICWQDSDDFVSNNKIAEQVKYLDEHPDIDVVTTTTMFSERTGIGNTISNLEHKDIVKMLKTNSMSTICHFQSAMFRKSVLDKFINGKYFYDEYVDGRCGEGLLYTLYFLGYKFANINTASYLYRIASDEISMSATLNANFANEINEKPLAERKKTILQLFKKYNNEKNNKTEETISKPKSKRGRPKKTKEIIYKVEE